MLSALELILGNLVCRHFDSVPVEDVAETTKVSPRLLLVGVERENMIQDTTGKLDGLQSW